MIRVWTAIGFIVIFVCVVWALGYIAPAIEFLAVGIIVGFICSPIVNWLETKGVGRALGAILALLIVLGVAIGVLAILGPLTLEQLNTLLSAFLATSGSFRTGCAASLSVTAPLRLQSFKPTSLRWWTAFPPWAPALPTTWPPKSLPASFPTS